MDVDSLLPGTHHFTLLDLHIDEQQHLIQVQLKSAQQGICCPKCGQGHVQLHSYYRRTVADLPWADFQVELELTVRKFFCRSATCQCRIFTERFSEVVAPWARRTQRLAALQTHLALTVSGSVGERLSHRLCLPVSLETLLRLIRNEAIAASDTPRVLGIDDWAKRKGQSYGTILVDLETHEVIDLLPERTAQAITDWLREHPGVEIISRDRAGEYAAGAKAGAPDAIQIADRWHLLKNLGEALTCCLQQYTRQLNAIPLTVSPVPKVDSEPMIFTQVHEPSQSPVNEKKRVERLARYQRVLELHALGWTHKAIAIQLDISSKTVTRWLARGSFPERQPRPVRQRRIEPYKPYILQRWQAGCQNAAQIFRELQQQGYPGGKTMVVDYIAHLREEQAARKGVSITDPQQPRLTPRHLTALLFKPAEERTQDQQLLLETVLEKLPELATALELVQDFVGLVRQRNSQVLDDWLERAARTPGFRAFVRGVRRDYAAVFGAVSTEVSNGQVEGQINRLKFIKRQMYGRAKFDLLRKRVHRYQVKEKEIEEIKAL